MSPGNPTYDKIIEGEGRGGIYIYNYIKNNKIYLFLMNDKYFNLKSGIILSLIYLNHLIFFVKAVSSTILFLSR